MRSALSLSFAALLVWGASCPTARAQPASDTIRIGALRSEAHTPLALIEEELEVDCQAPGSAVEAMPCTLHVRYTLENPDEEARAVALRFSVENADGFTVSDVGTEGRSAAPVLSMRRFPFDAGGRRTLDLSGAVLIEQIRDPGPQPTDALRARHPLLGTSTEAEDRGFVFSRAVARHFVGAPNTLTIRVRLPEGFTMVGATDLTLVPDRSVDGWQVYRMHHPADETDPDIRVTIRRGETPFIRNGGPFIALGGIVLTPDGSTPNNIFWARLGYEIGFVDWVLLSVAAETNFSSRFGMSVMLEAASPSFTVPPSFSVGVGAALRLASESPNVEAGVRLAVGAVLVSVGFEALFDFYPTDGGFTITLLGRAGL